MYLRFLNLFFLGLLSVSAVKAQNSLQFPAQAMPPDSSFENVCVKRLFGDANATGFLIWVKQSVPAHYHASHSETVYILQGKAEMQLGDASFPVKKGDVIFIPQATPHAVAVKRGTLKVLSIQGPAFDGKDRIPIH